MVELEQGQSMSFVFPIIVASLMFPCAVYSITMVITTLIDIKNTKEGREPKYPRAVRMAIIFSFTSVVSILIIVVSCIGLFHEISVTTTSSSIAKPDDCCPFVV